MQNTEARLAFESRCLRFGATVLKLVGHLSKDSRGKHIGDQVMRSGTSVGANVQEAQAGQSRADFIHKLQIALKEARETNYWLELLSQSSLIDEPSISVLADESRQIAAILAKSIITAKINGRSRK
jgi:four helix bundle protein